MKKQKKYVFRIVLLIIALVGTMTGLILWTNWTVNSNVVTVLKAVDTIPEGTDNLSTLVASEKVNKDATAGLNLVSLQEITYYKTAYRIPKGAIVTKDYLVTLDTDISGGETQSTEDNYVYFPITVNAANTSYGYLSLNQVVNIYGIKQVTDSSGTSQKMYGKLATNVQMVNIISGSFQGGGSASCTFKIEKEQLNTIVSYVNSGGTLYFLDGSINDGSDAEEFINQSLSSTIYSTVKNKLEIMPENGVTWEPCELDKNTNEILEEKINIVDRKVVADQYYSGFNFRWRDFLPDTINVKYYDLRGEEGIYFATYLMNGSSTIAPDGNVSISSAAEYFTHKYTYNSTKGIYTLGAWTTNPGKHTEMLHSVDSAFSDEGYYEIWLNREETITTSSEEGGAAVTNKTSYTYLYKFFVVDSTESAKASNIAIYYKDNNGNLKIGTNTTSISASYSNGENKIERTHAGVLVYEADANDDIVSRMSPDVLANYASALNYKAKSVDFKALTQDGGVATVKVFFGKNVYDDGVYSKAPNEAINALCGELRGVGEASEIANNYDATSKTFNTAALSEEALDFISACKEYDSATFSNIRKELVKENSISSFASPNDVTIVKNAVYYGILNGCEGEAGLFNLLPTATAAAALEEQLSTNGVQIDFGVTYERVSSSVPNSITCHFGNMQQVSAYGINVYIND